MKFFKCTKKMGCAFKANKTAHNANGYLKILQSIEALKRLPLCIILTVVQQLMFKYGKPFGIFKLVVQTRFTVSTLF